MAPRTLSLLLAALPVFAVELCAQEETQREDRGADYVLHLKSGAVLRGRARSSEAGWEIRRGKEWVALPAGSVARSGLEKELLEQARRLDRESEEGDPVRRVAYSDWLLHAGLHVESLKELDRILREHPDQKEALDLVRRANFALAIPELPGDTTDPLALRQFTSQAARSGAAAREVMIERLRSAGEVPGLYEALTGELEHASPGRRAFAALAFQRLFPGRGLRTLLSRAILDSSEAVRTRAALALAQAEEPSVVVPTVRALGSRYPEVRRNAIDALGNMKYGAGVQPLLAHLIALQSGGGSRAPHSHIFVGTQSAYVQDFDVEVAQNESIADPVINILQEGVVLDAAVTGVTEYVVRTESAAARRSLSYLTGANPGPRVADWQAWWEENGDEWVASLGPPPSSPESPGS